MRLPRSIFSALSFASLLLVSQACQDSPTTFTEEDLPVSFLFTGHAQGQVGDRSISCQLEWSFERKQRGRKDREGRLVFSAEYGGSAGRTVLMPDGEGVSLWPHLHCPDCQIRLWAGDSLEVFSELNAESETPVYVGIGSLKGRLTGSGSGVGTWKCGPLMTRGDDAGEVEGSWVIEPF